MLLGDTPVATEGDGDGRLHGRALVVALRDDLALVDEDFGDGVVEEDVQVERATFHAGDLFVADVRGTGRELGIGAQQDGGALIVDEGLLEDCCGSCGLKSQTDLLRGGGQAADGCSGAGRGSE